MPWVELLAVFAVCHLTGDFLLQTKWQAANKPGGLGHDPVKRRALVSHVAVYTLAFVPALIWVGDERGAGVALGAAALIFVPHLIQDDGRLLIRWGSAVKRMDLQPGALYTAVDQSFHFVVLFGTALLIAS